jgi:hypothetical protein
MSFNFDAAEGEPDVDVDNAPKPAASFLNKVRREPAARRGAPDCRRYTLGTAPNLPYL